MSLAVFRLQRQEPITCMVLGLGLVGNAVAELLRLHATQITQTKIDWSNPEDCAEKILAHEQMDSSGHLELIWAAGKAGFSADESQLQVELAFYSAVINRLKTALGKRLVVSLISSAGGVYEHSQLVNDVADTSASRPYAYAKLSQEASLTQGDVRHRIYRVSSVYGSGGKRTGLISAMLNGAISGTAVKIFAQQNTMRDYIYNQDVARVVVDDVLSDADSGTYILASGRAVSINMLLNMVAKISGKHVRAYYQSDASNENDISFAQHVVRRAENPTSLEEGIALLHKRLALVACS